MNRMISPQLQGLGPQELVRAQEINGGGRLVCADDGRALLTNAFVAEWHNARFFQNRYPDLFLAENIVYIPLTDEQIVSAPEDTDELSDAVSKLVTDRGPQLVFYDYYLPAGEVTSTKEELVHAALRRAGQSFREEYLGEDRDSYANVYHYSADVTHLEAPKTPESSLVVRGDQLELPTLDSMWKLYEREFAVLAEHPINGILPEEVFRELAKSPDVVHSVCFDASSAVNALASVSNNLGLFDWLDMRHFEDAYANDYREGRVWYGPTVVKDSATAGSDTLPNLVEGFMVAMALNSLHNIFAIECSDRSARYAPVQLQKTYDAHPEIQATVKFVGKQVYRAALIS